MQDAKYQDVVVRDSIEDDVIAYGETPKTGTEVLVAGAPDVGMGGEQEKAVDD